MKEFAGREDELRRLRACVESSLAGHITNVFIDGEWGIGKTSLLNKLLPELQEHGPVVSEDLADDSDQAVWFYNSIFGELLGDKPNLVSADQFEGLDTRDHRRLRKLLQLIWEKLRDDYKLIVVMLDNLERARPEFLSGVRDVFQRLNQERARYMLIFAGKRLPVPGAEAAEPVGRFFNPRILLRPLDEADGIEAVKKPVRFLRSFSFSDEAARLIHARAAGHPYFLRLICHSVYDLAEGKAEVDSRRLEELWPEVEERLVIDRFGGQFKDLPEGEKQTLLHASLLGAQFEAIELRSKIKKSLDTFLKRLVEERELLRSVSRGVYELYHPLFRTYLQALARERKLASTTAIPVPEGRHVLGREELEARIECCARRRLDIIDQHFRGRAVSMLEAAKPSVQIRILMGEDPAWSKTKRLLEDLEVGVRKRVQVRAWPDRTESKPIPWHYRCLIGDLEVWKFDHSLDGAGRKKAYLTDETARRAEHVRDFDRWWREAKHVFP